MTQDTSTYYVWIGGSCIFFSDQYYLDASRRQTLHTPNHRHPADRFFQTLSSQCKDSHKKPYRQKTAPYNLQKSVNKTVFPR